MFSDESSYHTSTILKILSECGEFDLIKKFLAFSEFSNPAGFFLLGKAFSKADSEELALAEFFRGGAMIESGNFEHSYQNFIKGPWDIENSSEKVKILSSYNDSVINILKGQNSKKIVLAEFITNSLQAEFNDETIIFTVEKLIKLRSFHEALTILQAHNNKRVIKYGIELMIEEVQPSSFFLFLELPLNSLIKEISLKKLQEKSIEDHFDLIKTVSSAKYYEKASGLFLKQVSLEDRIAYKSAKLS